MRDIESILTQLDQHGARTTHALPPLTAELRATGGNGASIADAVEWAAGVGIWPEWENGVAPPDLLSLLAFSHAIHRRPGEPSFRPDGIAPPWRDRCAYWSAVAEALRRARDYLTL